MIRRVPVLVMIVGLLIGVVVAAGPAASGGVPTSDWITTWGGSAMSPSSLVSTVQELNNQTVRNIVYTSAGGNEMRLRLSNAFGDRPVTISAAGVARQLRGAEIDAATAHPVTFDGRRSVRVERGASVLSDPVRMPVPALSNLAVSLYLPAATGPATYHQNANQTNYLAAGDHAADPAGDAFTTTVSTSFFVDSVQVRTPARGAIIVVGDSVSDGFASQNNANTRWPNFLARALAGRFGPVAPAVVDEGISGNRVLSASVCFGVSLLDRLDRDVLSQPGARTVVLLEGVNDLSFSLQANSGCTAPNTEISTDALLRAYRQVIDRVHARGMRIVAGTIPPAQGFPFWDAAAERKRQVVNAWIRDSHAFDGVIDFAALIAYPGRPELVDPKYDGGDHLHPNDAGYQAMAEAAARALAAEHSR